MHLAIVSPYPPVVTGIGQYGYHVSQALARSGAFSQITVLTGDRPGLPRVAHDKGLVLERVWQPGGWDAGLRVTARLRQLRPDITWYNLGASVFGCSPLANLSGMLTPWLGRGLGASRVVTLHEMIAQADLQALQAPGGVFARWGARLLTLAATQADVICLTLRSSAAWLLSQRPGLRCVHIPIGAYRPPERLPEPESPELLLFTTHAPFKGLELLLTAFQDLRQQFPILKLTIAGGEHPRFPGYLQQVRQQVGDLPGVRWAGYVPETGLKDLFARASVVVLPYTATTGSSSVLYQAAGWGRAVVSSNLPELRASATESRLDIAFFTSGDAADLRAVLAELLVDPTRRARMVERNLALLASTQVDQTCQAYLRAFDQALSIRRCPVQLAGKIQEGQS